MSGTPAPKRAHDHETLLDVAEISPTLALGALPSTCQRKPYARSCATSTRRASSSPHTPLPIPIRNRLSCGVSPGIRRFSAPARQRPLARVFEYLHTSLHQQGVLLAPPRLVMVRNCPRTTPCPPTNLTPDAGQLPRSRHQVLPSEGAIMTPGFSLRRMVFRRRYLHALIATDPHEAAARCINYWASKWRSTPVETPGMREQLALNGWVGTRDRRRPRYATRTIVHRG